MLKFTLRWMDKSDLARAQLLVAEKHYLHAPVDARCSPQGYLVYLDEGFQVGSQVLSPFVGVLIFGRPEATKCQDWYGGVEEMQRGECEVTRWQVLNLARVWFSPAVQPGGLNYSPKYLPGYTDRKGQFRSTFASTVITAALERIGYDYLLSRPPVFLDEPYNISWVLSYCDTNVHKGTLYRASGFEFYRENGHRIQTYRKPLKPLTMLQRWRVVQASLKSRRAQVYRGERLAKKSQLAMF
jgi:hypothetical protein